MVYAGLTSLQIFSRIPECTDRVAKDLSRVVTLTQYPLAHSVVFSMGDEGDAFYIVASGWGVSGWSWVR